MTLTPEDVQLLRTPFPAKEHEFFDGMAYVDEYAVSCRLDDVDPSWRFRCLSIKRTDEHVVAVYRLTVKGVSRDGVGMAKLTLKKKDGTIITAGEPEKSAATDALRRCSRLFGIGRYLLLLPGNVDTVERLAGWLGETPAKNPPPTSAAPAVPNNGTWTNDEIKAFVAWGQKEHNFDMATLLVALGLDQRFGEWKGTLESAKAKVDLYAVQQVAF